MYLGSQTLKALGHLRHLGTYALKDQRCMRHLRALNLPILFLTNQSSSLCATFYFDNSQFSSFLSRAIFLLFYRLRFIFLFCNFFFGQYFHNICILYQFQTPWISPLTYLIKKTIKRIQKLFQAKLLFCFLQHKYKLVSRS